jgi:hypothetical protein
MTWLLLQLLLLLQVSWQAVMLLISALMRVYGLRFRSLYVRGQVILVSSAAAGGAYCFRLLLLSLCKRGRNSHGNEQSAHDMWHNQKQA